MTRLHRLHLLGRACICRQGSPPIMLQRRPAALVAYLALEGVTRKAKLAGLLWPEVVETTARNNLRQLLKRLKSLCPTLVMCSDDHLGLMEGLVIDAVEMDAREGSRTLATSDIAEQLQKELLEGYDYGECGELSEWLDGQRARLRLHQQRMLRTAVTRLEKDGRLIEALELAQSVYEKDPTCEEDCRLLMGLHHLRGDRVAAFSTFQRCATALRSLDTEPSPETRRLLREIEKYGRIPPSMSPPRPKVPLSVAMPPVLVGREKQWALLEEAYSQNPRTAANVMGEAGTGKTRLITDFARSKTNWVHLWALPGDRAISFSTHARSFRTIFNKIPDLRIDSTTRHALARFLPEFRNNKTPPPLLKEEKQALFRTLAHFFFRALEGMNVVVFDNAHYIDQDSFEFGVFAIHYICERIAPERMFLIINSMRFNELPAAMRAVMRQNIEQGHRAIEMDLLSPPQVHQMLHGMAPGQFDAVSNALATHTQGNPLFVVEHAKDLLESDCLADAAVQFPARMPIPERVALVVARRLERLSSGARRLANALAITQQDISAELAAALLDVPVDLLVEPWNELEQAHIIKGSWFSHDLVGQVILTTMPAAIRDALERKAKNLQQK